MIQRHVVSTALFCYSERVFARGRIPTAGMRGKWDTTSDWFNHDLPKECAGFFTAFKMAYSWCMRASMIQRHMVSTALFCHSERAFGRGRIPTAGISVLTFLILQSWFVQWVRKILHCVQNGIFLVYEGKYDATSYGVNRLVLSFWTSFWARKNPHSGYEGQMGYNVRLI